MAKLNSLIEVGFDTNGEADFSISCSICELSVEDMNKLRAMIVCAIGTAEDMFRREIQSKNVASANREENTHE